MKKNLSDILHSAGDKTIENIADNYTAADKKTANRIYAKSLEKMNLSPENSETFIAEQVSRSPVLRPVRGRRCSIRTPKNESAFA